MSAHRALHDMFRSPFLMADPGDAGTITVDRWGAVVPVTTATAETRTLAQPTKAGLLCMVEINSYGGACTLTVTGGYNQAGSTVITLGTEADWIRFVSIKVGASYYWRIIAEEGTNATRTAMTAQTVTTLTATTANLGSIIIDQGAPAAIADGDTAITAANLQSKILTMASSTSGRAPTVPTGTAINGIIAVGKAIDWSFLNTGNQTVTITAATDHTLVGTMTIATVTAANFRTRCSAANTAITYRLSV